MGADTDSTAVARPLPMEGAPARGPSVVIEDLELTYRIYEDVKPTLRKLVAQRFRPRAFRAVEAVRGVSLTAQPGEAVGILGRNGSGKSTMLKCLAGLLPPTGGRVYARSTPVLLGVGAALQQELSGRRNIFLGGTALGIPRKELERRYGEIVEFAGLGGFIDMPMRAYSSGMKARLHFAIASTVTPDVLLIDEALAVGDAEFKHKSQERIVQLLGEAGTVFIVSHALGIIRDVCSRAIWLDKGLIVMDGPTEDVAKAYEDEVKRTQS
ncbi:ABC transporter ATP-binding protein [soil metagenome]